MRRKDTRILGSASFWGKRLGIRDIASMLLLAAVVGCAPRGASGPPADRRTATTAAPAEYPITGVVESVDPAAGTVRIAHEEVPGFMAAMTMDFEVSDPILLEDLRAGDEVEGSLRIDGGRSSLTELDVTRPALATTLTIDATGGGLAIGSARKPLEPGEPVPDFAMTTQVGEALRLSDLRGKAVALTFVYTRCPLPDACPLLDRKFAEVAGRVAAVPARAEGVRLLSVSFDPDHDTPRVLAEHAEARGATPPLWTFAVADHDELRKVAGALGLLYGPGQGEIMHTLAIALIGPDGALVRLETGSAARRWEPSEIARSLAAAVAGEGPQVPAPLP